MEVRLLKNEIDNPNTLYSGESDVFIGERILHRLFG